MTHPFESYYSTHPASRAERLLEIDAMIMDRFPGVSRSLKYRMPTYETPSGFIAAGSQKNHISVYSCSEEKIAPYVEKHPSINHGKGCLRFSDKTPIDFVCLEKVVIRALT